MKKLLYIATLPIDFKNLNGVPKKILNQINSFSKFFEIFLICYSEDNVVLFNNGHIQIVGKAKNGYDVLRYAKKLKNIYDFIYIRYPKSNFLFIKTLKHFSDLSKIIIEIPTYPYYKEGGKSLKSFLIKILDCCYRKKLKKYVKRIVTYSNDDFIFGIKTIKTINGIDFENTKLINYANDNNNIHIIAVSNMYEINGYERIIYGINEYLKESYNVNIIFDIVGEGPEKTKYIELVKKLSLENNVIFHGLQFGDELDALYSKAIIGINSLSIHLHDLKTESTLKTKEYGAKGLFIVSSYYIDSFDKQGNKDYTYIVPQDDSVVNIKKVLNKYFNVKSNESFDDLREKIRNNSIKQCDMSITLKPIINFYLGDSDDKT